VILFDKFYPICGNFMLTTHETKPNGASGHGIKIINPVDPSHQQRNTLHLDVDVELVQVKVT
jgi:hypothetical protein